MQGRIRNNSENNEEFAKHNGDVQKLNNTKKKYWSSQELESPKNTNSATLE